MTSVPKFTSFCRKAAVLPPHEIATHSNPIVEHTRIQEPTRLDDHRKAQDLKHGHRRAHGREPKRAEKGVKERDSSSSTEKWNEETCFVVDRKGNSANRLYGTNSSSLVPEHHLSTNRPPLGGKSTKLSRTSDMNRNSPISNLSRANLASLQRDGVYLGPSSREGQVPDHIAAEDFLSLDDSIKRKLSPRQRNGNELEQIENTSLPRGGESESESSNLSDISEHDTEPTYYQRGLDIRKEHARLLDYVKAEPHHLHGWLELIEFQDRWVRQSRGDKDSDVGGAEQRSVAEVRIALYGDALQKLGSDNDGRDSLLLGLLREGEKVWTKSKLYGKWADIASNNRNCLDLQLEYLNFLQASSPTFTYGRCRDQYADYIHLLSLDSKLSAHNLAVRQIYALLRFASYVRDAGFSELARSLWQSVLEITFLTPNSARNSYSETLNAFEEYWDDEYRRLGEEGWLGWYRSHDMSPPEPLTKVPEQQRSDETCRTENPISSWLIQEQSSKSRSLWACRTTDELDHEDDPYSVVFYADIKPFQIEILPEHRRLLINAFLCYHQLPSLPSSQSCPSRIWWQDPFLRSCRSAKFKVVSQVDMANMITTTETLFGLNQEMFISHVAESCRFTEQRSTEEFISNVLDALTKAMSEDSGLAEYYIAFSSVNQPLRARKIAKAMLNLNPSNLTIYNAYGLIQSHLGNEDESNHVFSTSIRLGASMDMAGQLETMLLQRTWVWQALKLNNIPLASQRLGSITPTVDAIRATLWEFRDTAIKHSLQSVAALASELLALYSYLFADSDSNNLAAALQTFSAESMILASPGIVDDSYPVELLHQAQAQLIQYHIRSGHHYSPKHVRGALRSSIASFPNNTAILSSYAENERRFRIDDRVRQLTREVLLANNKDSVIAWHFAVKTEMERASGQVVGATVNSVRATFQKAVSSRGAQHSVPLWVAYLNWETEVAKTEEVFNASSPEKDRKSEARRYDKARQVWLRGLNTIPWVKTFVDMGIEQLRDCITLDECKGFVILMADRGIRLHHDLDDRP